MPVGDQPPKPPPLIQSVLDGRAMRTADPRAALLEEAQPSPKLEELVEAAKQIEVQLSPVKTARTEQNLNVAHEMAARLKVELRNYMWSEAQPLEGEGRRKAVIRNSAAKVASDRTGFLSRATVQEGDDCQCDDEGPWAAECLRDGCRGPKGPAQPDPQPSVEQGVVVGSSVSCGPAPHRPPCVSGRSGEHQRGRDGH